MIRLKKALASSLLLLAGCGGEAEPRPRAEIVQDRLKVKRLYLTVPSGHRIIESGEKGSFVDPASGEIAWPAIACYASDCPGKGAGGEPFLFAAFDPGIVATADGNLAYDANAAKKQKKAAGCPKCAAAGRVANPQDVRPYILPESQAEIDRLDREFQREVSRQRDRP